MGVVAAVTVSAAVLYATEGAAEIVEAGTDYNFVRDGVFRGDEEAYERSKVILSTTMQIGTMIVGANACFKEGTTIATQDGDVPIEEITVGTMVFATDPETGKTALKEVVRLFRNETDEWIHITANDEEIVCTPGHPFWVPQKGWTKAVQLRAGDRLQLHK